MLTSPRIITRLMRVTAASALIASGALIAGCGDGPKSTCDTTARPGLAIAVGGRSNSPAPMVPQEVLDEINRIADAGPNTGKAVVVIDVDGNPEIICTSQFMSDSVNDAAKARDKRSFAARAVGVIGAVRADDTEADALAALSLAAATAGPDGTVVLIDSGIQTKPPLDMSDTAYLATDAEGVVNELDRLGQLPDLSGRNVILASLGYTAPPQQRLDEYTRFRLIQLWTALVSRASGGIPPTLVTGPNTNEAFAELPAVTAVPVVIPEPDFCNTRMVLQDTGSVGFVPDHAVFFDPGAARQVLTAFANWLISYPEAHATVVGHIAHYGANRRDFGLALQRAQTVSKTLVDLGVSPAQLTARGAGWGPYPDPTAEPDPRYDQANRQVVVEITCDGTSP